MSGKKKVTAQKVVRKKVEKVEFIKNVSERDVIQENALNEGEDLLNLSRKDLNNHQKKLSVQKRKRVERQIYDVPENLRGSIREEMTKITIPNQMFLKINGVRYNPGSHNVPRHLADTMRPMIDAKMQNLANVSVGKNYRLDHAGFGRIKEVAEHSINVESMTKG